MRGLLIFVFSFVAVTPPSVAAAKDVSLGWDITGGSAWEKRTGFGVAAGLGGVDCTDDYCDHTWDTSFFGSFAGFAGGYWRPISNLVISVDAGMAYVNTDVDGWWRDADIDDDRGMLFQLIGAGSFHAPITGWMDAHLGLGIGYAYLGFWSDVDGFDIHTTHHGLDFELRTGADLYLFSSAPTFALGIYFRLGMPVWIRACYDVEDAGTFGVPEEKDCDDPDDLEQSLQDPRPGYYAYDIDEGPFLVHFGIAVKYGF
ncbi:MAG: hypothetical protein R6V85_07965 [Polyangia bacterium]